ncbi:unnamed protein product, partial [Pocillopora meandrina]
FLLSGALKFTRTPENSFLALEGDNITLEWRYTFVDGESFLSASFRMGRRKVVDKHNGNRDSKPIIQRAYRRRLHANMTNDYTSITLLAVNRLDKGSYTIEISSLPNADANTSEVEISVLYLDQPNIASTDTRPVEGTAVTFYCNSSGEPQPTTSWTMNGSPLDTNSNSGIFFTDDKKHLTIVNVSRTDSGEYQCVTNNSLGNISSNASILRVQHKPKINPLLQMIHRTEGGEVIIFCNATGNPAPRISWTRNGHSVDTSNSSRMDLSHEGRQLSIKNVSSLLINQSTSRDAGDYTCLVINAVGNSSQKTSIISQELPLMNIHPEGKTPMEGENMTLSCNATGNPEPSISWVKDGFPINSNSRISISHDKQRLTIKNVSRMDSGEYRCVARNRVGNDTSNSKVNVLFRAEIVSHRQVNVTKEERSNLTLFCNATGNPAPIIFWTKDGSSLSNSSRIRFSKHNRLLTISNLNRKDSGHYRCVANNSLGNDTSNVITVDIQCKPAVKDLPERTIFKVGDVVVLTCEATGDPKPSVTWSKDGNTSIPRAQFRNDDHILVIQEVALGDGGIYECRASNIFGQRRTAIVVVIAVEPEVTIDGDHEQYVAKGSDIRLICRHDAFPPVSEVQWIKNGTAISGNTSRLISDSRVTISSFSKSQIQLTITAASLKDGGNYTCRVMNILNSTQDTTLITIVGILVKRIPTQNITVDTKGSRVINISWTVGFDGNCAIKNYTVEISQHDQILKDVVCQGSLSSSTCVVSRLSTTASLTGIFPWTTYNIRVFASNKIGRSNSSPILNVTTDEEEPSSTPQAVTVCATSSKSIFVSWDPVIADDRNGIIKGYIVNHQALPNGYIVAKILNITNEEQNDRQTVTLSNLNEFTNYSIGVLTFTVFGNGPVSVGQVVETLEDKPSGAPQAVTVGVTSSRSISVSWHPVIAEDRNGIIKGYKVNYHALPNNYVVTKFLNISKEQQNKRQTVTLDNLNEFTNYSIGVLAFTLLGNGPASVGQVVETLEDKPSNAPHAVTVSATSSRRISVSWDPIVADGRNGIIRGYIVNYQALPKGYIVAKILNITNEEQNNRQTVTLVGLNEFTNYSIGVLAFTIFGNGPASVGQVVETLED